MFVFCIIVFTPCHSASLLLGQPSPSLSIVDVGLYVEREEGKEKGQEAREAWSREMKGARKVI